MGLPTQNPSTLERREEVIHAAWRVVASGGLSALTIRSIANELSCTTGVVMHHFATKEAILEEMIDRLYGGLREVCEASVAGAAPDQRLERLLTACLPLDSATEFGWKLAVVLQAEALRSPAIAALHQRHHDLIEAALQQELKWLAEHQYIKPATDISKTCTRLMALIEGIGTHAVLRPRAMPSDLQLQLLRDELSLVFVSAPCL